MDSNNDKTNSDIADDPNGLDATTNRGWTVVYFDDSPEEDPFYRREHPGHRSRNHNRHGL